MFDLGLPQEFTRYFSLLESRAALVAQASIALPLATALGAVLAFRPHRPGTPPRSAPVIQTQIVLAVVGALVMFIVGQSLARAFGIVGAANLIRYRANIDDPKDAVVMLATLTVGLATGVELYALAIFSTLFVLGLLWVVESFEPERRRAFELRVTWTGTGSPRDEIESILRRSEINYEMRSASATKLTYQTDLPLSAHIDHIADAILPLLPNADTEVAWVPQRRSTDSASTANRRVP
jgi:hypothetical protein